MIQIHPKSVIIYVEDEEAAYDIEYERFQPVPLFIGGHMAVLVDGSYDPVDVDFAMKWLERGIDGDYFPTSTPSSIRTDDEGGGGKGMDLGEKLH